MALTFGRFAVATRLSLILPLVAVGACEAAGPAQAPSIVVGQGEPGASAAASPGQLPAVQPSPLPTPTEAPLGPAPGASRAPMGPRDEGLTTPPTPRPTSTPTPAPTLPPTQVIALSPVASPSLGPAGQATVPWTGPAQGLVTLSQPGFVPLTYEVGDRAPSQLTLSSGLSERTWGAWWELAVEVPGGGAGLGVSLSRPGQAPEVLGRTNAQGQLTARVRGSSVPAAILVVRSQENLPRVALQRLSLGLEGGELSARSLQLSPAVAAYRLQGTIDFGPNPFPDPPPGTSLVGGAICALEGGASPWVAELFSLPAGMLASYRVGDFALGRVERALSADGRLGAEVGGTLETGFPPFLLPPNLDAVERPVVGGRVAWPPVEGAAAYQVRLRQDDGSNRLLWEAALRQPQAPIPADAAPFVGPVRLEVEAIQAAGATVFQLAQLGPRGLRLTEGLPSLTGRRAWASKSFN